MTLAPMHRARLHPSIVLSAYIEPLVRGRRVAILGDATVGFAEELSERGARLVHAYDPDPARTAEAIARTVPGRPPSVSYAVLAGDLGVRDGAFDVVVVPDLSLFADPTDTMRRVRRLVSATGAAVIVVPSTRAGGRSLVPASSAANAKTPSYYELYDLVSLQFARVKMVGQAPFVGYTVAELAPGAEPEVSVDTSFLTSSEEPEYFIAVAGDRPVAIDPYTVFELPWTDVSDALGAGESPPSREDERLALTETRARLAVVVAELERSRDKQQLEARAAVGQSTSAQALSARVVELSLEIEGRDARLRELDARAGDNHVRAERLTHQIRDLEEELRRQRERAVSLTRQLDEEKRARTKSDLDLGMIRGRPEIAGAKDRIDALSAELDIAKSQLEEAAAARDGAMDRARKAEARAHRVLELETALESVERARNELVEQNRRFSAQKTEADARFAGLTKLSSEATARVPELERKLAEARSRVADLEQRLEDGGPRVAVSPGDDARVAELSKQLAETQSMAGAADAEIATLEAALRERGQIVATLKRDLRESERIGKEILADLEAAQTQSGVADDDVAEVGSPTAELEALRERLDTLAVSAARSEADLQAATWRNAQLERELAEAALGPREAGVVQLELEAALAAARDEVAELRRAPTP